MRDAFDIAKDFVVPKPQDIEILPAQMRVACRVDALTGRRVVLAAIDLDDKARGIAGKVDDEVIDWHLPAEMKTPRFQRAQEAP